MADLKSEAKREFLGQPAWVWGIVGAVVLVTAIYLYRKRSAATAAQDAGTGAGAGTVVSPGGFGTLTGVVQDLQTSPVAQATHFITVPKGMTLAQLAERNHWTPATYAEIQRLNSFTPSTRLHKGQQILRPTGVGVAA